MKITILSPPFDTTGGQRVAAIYAQKLHQRGHEVVVVGAGHARPTFREIVRSLVRERAWPRHPRPAFTHFGGVDAECRETGRPGPIRDSDVPDADLVIATWWETAEWVAALPPSKGVKVHYMQDYEIWGGPRERVEATCRLPIPKILLAEWVGKILRERFHFTDYTVVPCAVDTGLFHAEPRGKQARPTVGLIYTTFYNKGYDISLKAIEIARRKVPDLQVVAFGPHRPLRTLPLPTGCDFSFEAPDDRLRDIYSRCDAWLFGTRIEGFGLPILEAMACRTPVIGTPAGAAPELIGLGGGYLVRPEDPEDLAAAIERIVAMPDDEWRAMSDIALATASRYSWDDAADRFEAALIRAFERSKVAVS
jgi:glycosyltransferase involved in cell wall biosynthesis